MFFSFRGSYPFFSWSGRVGTAHLKKETEPTLVWVAVLANLCLSLFPPFRVDLSRGSNYESGVLSRDPFF